MFTGSYWVTPGYNSKVLLGLTPLHQRSYTLLGYTGSLTRGYISHISLTDFPWGLWLIYPLVMTNIAMERSTMLLIGKPSINGPFSMAMSNNQRVYAIKLPTYRDWGWLESQPRMIIIFKRWFLALALPHSHTTIVNQSLSHHHFIIYPLVNKHRPWKSPIFWMVSLVFQPRWLPGSNC